MPITTRTFRIFVSSTFEDLKEERNALQREVWPKLRALCEQHGARFQAIDLRWGIRDEAALDQKTMDICLREIERCQATRIKQNFIVLLGDRYGWLPLPTRIPASELDPRPAAGDWYKLDENAIPAEYVLQPRAGIFTNPDIWSVMEQFAARQAGIRRAHGQRQRQGPRKVCTIRHSSGDRCRIERQRSGPTACLRLLPGGIDGDRRTAGRGEGAYAQPRRVRSRPTQHALWRGL